MALESPFGSVSWLDIGAWIEWLVDWITTHAQPVLDVIHWVINFFVHDIFGNFLTWLNPWVFAVLLILLAAWRAGIGFFIFCVVALYLFSQMHLWPETMSTFALVLGSAIVCLLIGLPLGIAMARSNKVEAVFRPILDFMQTMPPFVYLIPAVIFFGLGEVPGAIATVVFATPPVVRLTNLGIRQVNEENIEAGLAFGCTPRQLLMKVQIPLALPTIMQGVNQTIMLALSMVVIASMIGAGGLGDTVLTGIQRLQIGLGFEGGLGVVLVAIILDRLTQTVGGGHGTDNSLFGSVKRYLGKQQSQSESQE